VTKQSPGRVEVTRSLGQDLGGPLPRARRDTSELEHDLVDELRLTVFPVALGAGERLFGETSDKRPLRPIDTDTIGNGLAHLTHERAGDA
jgi:hypothetical protein